MDVYQKLTILTFVTSTLTLILVAVAVLPHVKQGMVVIRDAILWVGICFGRCRRGLGRLATRFRASFPAPQIGRLT